MIMNRPSVEEMNKASYIGGCLPIWGISHIKNEDFKYLTMLDRNYESRKNFGVLPLRDISRTPPPYANVAPVNNAPDVVAVFHLVPNVEVNNANSVPEALNEDTSIDSKSPRIISEGPCCTAKVEQNVKVKQEPHLKPEVPSQDVVKQEPIGPKFENISVLNSVYQTPIFPVHGTSLNTNSVEQATTSQPKEEKFLSTEAADIIFSSGVNAKKKFYND